MLHIDNLKYSVFVLFPILLLLFVVVLTLTRIIKSVVTGQAPVTLELRSTPGKNTHNPRWYTHISQLTPIYVYPAQAVSVSLPPRETFFFLHPIYYPRTTLALPLSSNSDPWSHRGPSSPLPTPAVRAFIFIASRIQHLLPSSTWVEL